MLLPESESYLLSNWNILFFSPKDSTVLQNEARRSHRAPAFWDRQNSLKHFQPNPWRGKHIFQPQDSRLKKCVPHLFTKHRSSCSEASPHPWTDRHLEEAPSPASQSAQARPSGKRAPSPTTGGADSSAQRRHRGHACPPGCSRSVSLCAFYQR